MNFEKVVICQLEVGVRRVQFGLGRCVFVSLFIEPYRFYSSIATIRSLMNFRMNCHNLFVDPSNTTWAQKGLINKQSGNAFGAITWI